MKNKGMVIEAIVKEASMNSVGKTLIPPKKDSKGRSIPWTEDKINSVYRQDGIMMSIRLEFYLSNQELAQLSPDWSNSITISLPRRDAEAKV